MPFTPLASVEVKAASDPDDANSALRILTFNVLGPNRQSNKLLDLVRENSPDLLVTLESNAWWQERLDQLELKYPHSVKCPLENLNGMHAYSRLPLADSRIEYLVESDIPSIHTCVTLPSGCQVSAHFLHPSPPNPKFNDESSERDAELVMVAKHVAQHDEPTVVCGDLNDVAWVTDHAAVPKAQRPARPARRPRHVQHLPCQLVVHTLAAGSRVPQQAFHPERIAPLAIDRFGSFPAANCAPIQPGKWPATEGFDGRCR